MTAEIFVGSNARLSSLKCVLVSQGSNRTIRLTSNGNGVFSSQTIPVQTGDQININFWGRLEAGWGIKIDAKNCVVTPNSSVSGNFGDSGPYEITPGNVAASFIILQNSFSL